MAVISARACIGNRGSRLQLPRAAEIDACKFDLSDCGNDWQLRLSLASAAVTAAIDSCGIRLAVAAVIGSCDCK